MTETTDLDWLEPQATRFLEQRREGRASHALLIVGAPGVGKRCLAAWFAARHLAPAAAPPLPQFPAAPPVHPDLHWVTRPEDRQSIGVEQVRALIDDLHLTAHEGGAKAAVVEPAQLMTRSTANGLLKTLEEPSDETLIILVADRLTRLPATILSRCQRVTVPVPTTAASLAWLERLRPAAAWADALAEAGGAPLAALAALEELDDTAEMARDLFALAARRESPVEVAERWLKRPPERVLDWLGRQVQACIRRRFGGTGGPAPALAESVLQRMDSRNLFCYLDTINRLRGQAGGSYNPQLTLEALLIDWSEGLAGCRQDPDLRGLWP